ncbi:MAG TPA: PEGA domain-containing protein, partial [Polyangiaceae bacterium]
MLAKVPRRIQRVLCVASAGLVLSLGFPVRAEVSAADREQARKLAAEGFEALERKDYATAEDRFRRADAIIHAPTLVVDHARALVGLGRLVEAHERYELVLREGIAPNAPWQWRSAHADAERELEEIKPRLAWLTLRVLGPSKPVVLVDNKNVPLAALGVRRATDPGTHSVTVSAPGYLPKEEIVSLDEGETVSLEVELEVDPNAIEEPVAEETEAAMPAPRRRSLPQEPDNT